MSKPIIIEPLENAVSRLAEALSLPKDDIVRDASVQRFEFTYELSWKTIKRFLKEVYEKDDPIFVEMLKQAAQVGIIDNLEIWNSLRKSRNYTSHNYSEAGAENSYENALILLPLAQKLVLKLSEINQKISDD